MPKTIDIIILAKVVDNYGDIGVTWRLAKHLVEWKKSEAGADFKKSGFELKLRLITDNLLSFSNINSRIFPDKTVQECDGVTIYDWNNETFCYKEFTENPPFIILECFQCGYPDWLEKILFDDRVEHKVNIIMIDYLSAEKYQEDFHCLKSLTRTAWVPKVNFMPGFTPKTGGLLLQKKSFNKKTVSDETVRMLFFAYKKDWTPVIRGINGVFGEKVQVIVAEGQGKDSILEACKSESALFEIQTPGFMDQEKWDQMMASMDVMIIRGEESMAQGCLSGIPFIWQAYPQKDDYQTVKVNALLDRMRNHFGEEFRYVENAWKVINEDYAPVDLETAVKDFLIHRNLLKRGFEEFAASLEQNGDLAFNLMTFIEKSIIIEGN